MERDRQLSECALFRRSATLLTAEVDGDLMAMSVDNGVCYGLDRIGTRIWSLLDEPRSLDQLCTLLVAEFDVDATQCRRDVGRLLDELRGEGLVELSDGSAAHGEAD